MKFKKDLMWFEVADNLVILGDDQIGLKFTGPIIEKIAHTIENHLDLNEVLVQFKSIKQYQEIQDVINSYFTEKPSRKIKIKDFKTILLNSENLVEIFDLNLQDTAEITPIEIYAKNVDPTAVVGIGGYDDDPAS